VCPEADPGFEQDRGTIVLNMPITSDKVRRNSMKAYMITYQQNTNFNIIEYHQCDTNITKVHHLFILELDALSYFENGQ